MAKSKEELEREIDRLLENSASPTSGIRHSDNIERFYDSVRTKNKSELDNINRLSEIQAQMARMRSSEMTDAQWATYGRLGDQASTISQRIELDSIYRDERARTSFTAGTKRSFGPDAIAHDAAQFARQISAGEVSRLARTSSTSQLRERMQEAHSGVTAWGEHAASIAQQFKGTPQERQEYMQMMSYRQEDIHRMSVIDQALRAQKRLGLDIGSREESLERFRGGFERDRVSAGISRDFQAGKFESLDREMKKLEEAASKVSKALDAMSNATDRSDENLERLASAAEQARSQYEYQKEVVGTVRGGGGGGRGRAGMLAMEAAGAGLGAIGSIIQGVGIDNQMAITQNRIGQVNLANSRHYDVQAAGQGDMAAYRRVITDQYTKSVAEGLRMRDVSRTAQGFDIASTATMAAAGATGGFMMGSVVPGLGNLAGGILGGIAGGAAGVANTINKTHGALNDVQADSVMLARAQQMKDLSNAVNAIGDEANQAGFDYRRGVMYATRGIGAATLTQQISASGAAIMPSTIRSGRNETTRLMEQDSTIDALRGLSADERVGLLSYGVGAMGARMGGQRGINMMATGQNLAQLGLTRNAEQFIGMSARLTGASGDENVMLRGMKVAIAEGMQGAQVFQQMSEAIGSLGDATAALGTKITEGFAARFAGTAGQIRERGYSDEQAIRMAQQGMSRANQMITDDSLSLGNVSRWVSTAQRFGAPKNSFEQMSMVAAQRLNIGQWDELKGISDRLKTAPPGSPEYAKLQEQMKQAQMNAGVGNLRGGAGMSAADIEGGRRDAAMKMLVDTGAYQPDAFKRVMSELDAGKGFSPEVKTYLKGAGVLEAFEAVTSSSTKTGAAIPKGPTGEAGTMERMTEYMKDIADKLTKEGLKLNTQDMEKMFKIVGQSYDPRKMGGEAKKTAETGEVPASQFAESVQNLAKLYDGMSETLMLLNKNISAMNSGNQEAGATFNDAADKFSSAVDKMSGQRTLQNNVNRDAKRK